MKFKLTTSSCALLLSVGAALTFLTVGAASLSASSDKKGTFHASKECSTYAGQAGGHCTFTSSNLSAITIGTKIYYDQAAGIPAMFLDSNVVLDAGSGNRAFGRCSVDFLTGVGLCTFTDGTGTFTGFHARVNVVPTGGPNYSWDGTYSFDKD